MALICSGAHYDSRGRRMDPSVRAPGPFPDQLLLCPISYLPKRVCLITNSSFFKKNLLSTGADDNASGSSAVLEAARVLHQQPFEYSVRRE